MEATADAAWLLDYLRGLPERSGWRRARGAADLTSLYASGGILAVQEREYRRHSQRQIQQGPPYRSSFRRVAGYEILFCSGRSQFGAAVTRVLDDVTAAHAGGARRRSEPYRGAGA